MVIFIAEIPCIYDVHAMYILVQHSISYHTHALFVEASEYTISITYSPHQLG